MKIWLLRLAYWVRKATRASTRQCTHTHAHMVQARTRKSIHPRERTHARTHAHRNVLLIAFPRQQWFRKRASVLRYTHIACVVYNKIFIE